MVKKYAQYIALMIILMTCNPSFCMEDKQANANNIVAKLIGTGIGAGIAYGATRFIVPEIYKRMTTYEDVSPEVQQWAKKIMQECGENIDAIPLKKGRNRDSWMTVYGSAIIFPENFDPNKYSKEELLQKIQAFKHEVGHFKNNDYANRVTTFTVTTMLGKLLYEETSPLIIPGLVITGYGMNMAYCKYRESEADRFALERAMSKEELEAFRNDFIQDGNSFRLDMLTDPTVRGDNFIEKKLLSAISQKIKNNIRLAPSVGNDSLKIKELLDEQEIYFDAAFFIYDREHPSWKRRANMAQDYINKRDKEWAQKHLSTLFTSDKQP